jgi:hypothetical protein
MIDKNDVETQVWRDPETRDVPVGIRLVHKPTGIAVESWEHDTQEANRDAAMRELERRVSELSRTPPLHSPIRRLLGRFTKPS